MGVRDVILADNPTAYWRCADAPGSTTAVDETGNHDATYLGAPTLGVSSPVPSSSATAAQLDGVNDYIDTGVTADPGSAFSFAVWITTPETLPSNNARLVSKDRTGAQGSFMARWDPGNGRLDFRVAANGYESGLGSVNIALSSSTTYHIVGVYDDVAGRWELWANGALASSASTRGSVDASTQPLVWAAESQGTERFFGLRIADAAYWTRALTQAEIEEQHATGVFSGTLSGAVEGTQGSTIAALIRAHLESTGEFVGEHQLDGSTDTAYSITTTYDEPHVIEALPPSGSGLAPKIHRGVIPVSN